MMKESKIPRLGSHSYGKSYFRHEPVNTKERPAPEYFEIQQRCLWKNEIPAHRLDFYLVFLVTGGRGTHTIGAEKYHIKENSLCFISPHVINSWQADTDEQHRGFFCAFSDNFFNLGRTDRSFLNELPFFQVGGQPVIELPADQAQYYLSLFSDMYNEFTHQTDYSANILRSQLHVLINKAISHYHCYEEKKVAYTNRSASRLLKSFTALYMDDFKKINEGKIIQLRKLAEYAKELGVSQNHLNDSIKAITGHSAGQLIRNQIIKQASMCLQHSSKSVSEIAFLLGFEDPSYFARYFKNQTGKQPSDFRKAAHP